MAKGHWLGLTWLAEQQFCHGAMAVRHRGLQHTALDPA